jgi:hypothetical protein
MDGKQRSKTLFLFGFFSKNLSYSKQSILPPFIGKIKDF